MTRLYDKVRQNKNSFEQAMQTKIGRNVEEDMCEQSAENLCVDQRLNHPNPICLHTSNPYDTISYTYIRVGP